MSIETILRSTIAMLGTCHVLGSESETFGAALKNLKTVVNAIDQAKKEGEEHGTDHKQGADV